MRMRMRIFRHTQITYKVGYRYVYIYIHRDIDIDIDIDVDVDVDADIHTYVCVCVSIYNLHVKNGPHGVPIMADLLPSDFY